jgi:hypothetical protein
LNGDPRPDQPGEPRAFPQSTARSVAGRRHVYRPAPRRAPRQVRGFEPYKIPRPNVYDVVPDSSNNGYFS